MIDIEKIKEKAATLVRARGVKEDSDWYPLLTEPIVFMYVLEEARKEAENEEFIEDMEQANIKLKKLFDSRIECCRNMRWNEKEKKTNRVDPNEILDSNTKKELKETMEGIRDTITKSIPLVLEDGIAEDYERIGKDINELLDELLDLNETHMTVINTIYGLKPQPKGIEPEELIIKNTGTPTINTVGYLGSITKEKPDKDEKDER